MAAVVEEIELQTNCSNPSLRLTHIEKSIYPHGAEYCCTLIVFSGGFSCNRRFYFDEHSLTQAVAAFQGMSLGTPGIATIGFRYEKDCLRFAMNQLGHVIVSGELFDFGQQMQSLKFAFRTDQTVLVPLITDLAALQAPKT